MKKIRNILNVLLIVCLLSLTFLSASAAAYVLGDADGDGYATITDATLIQRALLSISYDENGKLVIERNEVFNAYLDFFNQQGLSTSEMNAVLAGFLQRGDVDGDGMLDIADATFIQRYDISLPTPYPIGQSVEDPTEPSTEAPTQAPTAKPDPYELPPV